ncbi:hypothetical protein BKA93DRAFT_809724 [Sparassis latifolia]
MSGCSISSDSVAAAAFGVYSSLNFRVPIGKYTILASFVLSKGELLKVISLATGSKCLPTSKFSDEGDALHDSHAEVLARRGAVRWFLEEVQRTHSGGFDSPWIKRNVEGKYEMNGDVQVHMYISTVPSSFQGQEMAELKDSAVSSPLPPNTPARGRNNYSLYGVLRTKPGRADSPSTLCMSCSDKIARWNVLGFQGALASNFLYPLYIATLVIGEVDAGMQSMVKEDCERALWKRLDVLHHSLPPRFNINKPAIRFAQLPFIHSSTSLGVTSSCSDSLCWIGDSLNPAEVLINGIKRGVPPKHQHNPKFRPQLSKVSLFHLCERIAALIGNRTLISNNQCTNINLRNLYYKESLVLSQGG